MFRNNVLWGYIITTALLLFLVGSNGNIGTARADDDGCDLPGKSHDDNNPSSKKFKELAYSESLCKIAKCVDTEECSNHTKLDWNKFKASPAYQNAEEDEQKALEKWKSDGNGAEGLVGYEILQIVEGDY